MGVGHHINTASSRRVRTIAIPYSLALLINNPVGQQKRKENSHRVDDAGYKGDGICVTKARGSYHCECTGFKPDSLAAQRPYITSC
jgi:hypothetical protein